MAKYYTYGDPYANTTGTSASTYTNTYTNTWPLPGTCTYSNTGSCTLTGPNACPGPKHGIHQDRQRPDPGYVNPAGEYKRGGV